MFIAKEIPYAVQCPVYTSIRTAEPVPRPLSTGKQLFSCCVTNGTLFQESRRCLKMLVKLPKSD